MSPVIENKVQHAFDKMQATSLSDEKKQSVYNAGKRKILANPIIKIKPSFKIYIQITMNKKQMLSNERN